MQLRRLLRIWVLAVVQFLAVYYTAFVLGFPAVVLALGYHLRDGWTFLVAHPALVVYFGAGLPCGCVVCGLLMELRDRVGRQSRPAA